MTDITKHKWSCSIVSEVLVMNTNDLMLNTPDGDLLHTGIIINKCDAIAIANHFNVNQEYKNLFEAAKAFIDCHAGDPDMTNEMIEKYSEYTNLLSGLEKSND